MADLKIKEFMKESERIAKEKGFRDREIPLTEFTSLIMTELAEVVEEARKGKMPTEKYYKDGKPEGIPAELADVVIRCFEMAEYYGIDLEEAMMEKQEHNSKRTNKHGKVF